MFGKLQIVAWKHDGDIRNLSIFIGNIYEVIFVLVIHKIRA